MNQTNIATTTAEWEGMNKPVLSAPTADVSKRSVINLATGSLNTTFAQLDAETMRLLFPNGYIATCQTLAYGRRSKTPSLRTLCIEMNNGEKVVINVVLSGTKYLVPVRLLCERSAWFSAELVDHEFYDSVAFTMTRAVIFESVLKFMCTGHLHLPSQEDEVGAALEICMLACKLKMEDLEWCAVGRLEEYFKTNKDLYLSRSTINLLLDNTECTSHLREWLADHVAGCLSSGRICAGALGGLVASTPDFAVKIMMSMQETVMGVTNALLEADVNNIEKAPDQVKHGGNWDGDTSSDEAMESDRDEYREIDEYYEAEYEAEDDEDRGTAAQQYMDSDAADDSDDGETVYEDGSEL